MLSSERQNAPKGQLLRSSWHLFRVAFMQCGQTGRNAVVGQ